MHTRFIELAGEVNAHMPDYVISKVVLALNAHKKAVKDSNILVLGISYKKNVDDMRESPSVVIMEKLESLGANIAYCDPHIPVFPKMREHHFDLNSVAFLGDNLSRYDCIVLATDHDTFDYALLLDKAQLIIDCRGRYSEKHQKIIKA